MNKGDDREIPLEWLVCPVTKEALDYRDGFLETSAARYGRAEPYDFWDLTPNGYDQSNMPAWEVWNQLQENGMSSYIEDPVANIAVGPIPEYVAFGEFCDFHGIVLDVGVGPQSNPTHLEQCRGKGGLFVGIDPLVGEQPRDFAFVKGLGEYLPFRDQLFDQVLFVTSLDHFIDPAVALVEACRVLRDDGTLCIFHGEKDPNTPRPARSPAWYEKLRVPPGAEDPFHIRRFPARELDAYLEALKLQATEVRVYDIDPWRRGFFYRVVKTAHQGRDR
jgi:SAM-dependent methyltransferase